MFSAATFQKSIIICNMGFNHHTAYLICNEMGFPRARNFTTRYQYHMQNHVRDKLCPYDMGHMTSVKSYGSYDIAYMIWLVLLYLGKKTSNHRRCLSGNNESVLIKHLVS